MSKIAQEIQEYSKKMEEMEENENLRKIWDEIDGSIVYYVKIGISGDTTAAKIEDREGIAYKKIKESIVFTHGRTEIEIPITENIKFSEYPGGSENIPDCLGISIHSKDFLIEASIEFSGGKSDEYYNKLRKQLNKETDK